MNLLFSFGENPLHSRYGLRTPLMTAVGLFVCNLHEVVERSRLAAAWKLCCERHLGCNDEIRV